MTRDGRHQLGIRADKDIIANNRFMLVRTIVVAGDGARADIDVITDLRIAQIGQMTCLGAFPETRFFHFHEVANVGAFQQFGAWTQTGKWADVGIGPYRALANPYCLANFERKANLTQ